MDQDRTGRGRGRDGRARQAAAAAALMLLAGLPAEAEDAGALATLTVRGSAAVAQAPDLAHMTVAVSTRGPSLDAAVRDHAARVAAAKAVLARLAASGVTVDEGRFDLGEEPATPAPDGRRAASTYRAETRFDLTLRALDRLDATVGEIAGAGLFDVESARFGTADSAGATDRARRGAMADARHQAEVYAEAGGLRLDAIQRIADADAAGAERGFAPRAVLRAASVGVAPPSALEFTASVTVTWRVAPR